jgi:hypothetical protein
MDTVGRSEVMLRFRSEGLDPRAVTTLLGIEPTISYRTGERVPVAGVDVVARWGLWHAPAVFPRPGSAAPLTIDEQIRVLMARVPSPGAAWEDLAKIAEGELYCSVFMGAPMHGIELSREVLMWMAQCRLGWGASIHAPSC